MSKYDSLVSTKITEEDLHDLEELVDQGHHKNRGEFIRAAIKRHIDELKGLPTPKTVSEQLEIIYSEIDEIKNTILKLHPDIKSDLDIFRESQNVDKIKS